MIYDDLWLILGTSVSPPMLMAILVDETFGQEAGYLQPQQEAKFLASQAFDSGKNSIVASWYVLRLSEADVGKTKANPLLAEWFTSLGEVQDMYEFCFLERSKAPPQQTKS